MKSPSLARIVAVAPALVLAAAPAAAQVLRGTVLDTTSGTPVDGVRVMAFRAAGARIRDALTMNDGRFVFRLPAAGEYRLQASRLGYAVTITEPITVDPTSDTDVILALVRRPVSLDTVTVAARNVPAAEKQLAYLVDAGFYRRRRWGFGYFLTREDIDKRHPLIMADVLRDMPGARIKCTSATTCSITMRAATSMFIGKKCMPSIVLDGVVISPGGTGGSGSVGLDGPLNPFNIEAVEVYPGPAGVPVQYGGYLSPCGAIIAWSRR